MVVPQPLIDLKSTSGGPVLEIYGPLRLEKPTFIIFLKFVFVDQYNPSG